MARLNSFYYPTDYWPSLVGDTALIKGNEAKHMLTVLRTEAEQTVRLFDGKGRDGLFRVKEVGNKRAILEAIRLNQHPEPGDGLTLAIGWGKSKRRNYLFEKAVELRVEGIAFWGSRRSQGMLPKTPKETWKDRCLQAAKQCGNPYIPKLSTLGSGIHRLVEFADGFSQCYLAWESTIASTPLSPADFGPGKTLIVVGPEGGLDDKEALQLVDSGFKAVTLGDSILRWETAATYCMSLGMYSRQVAK